MGKVRSVLLGGVIGAAAGVVFAPRHGESRREALARLRVAARPGRGSLCAFAGTPCAAAGQHKPVDTEEAAPGGGVSASPPAAEGDEHG